MHDEPKPSTPRPRRRALEAAQSMFPSGGIVIRLAANADVEEVRITNALGNEVPLPPLFDVLREAGAPTTLKTLVFEVDGDGYADCREIDPQEAIDLIHGYGPFEALEHLELRLTDFIQTHPIRDFSGLEAATPRLTHLELQVDPGIGLSRPISLPHVQRLRLWDVDTRFLSTLGACSFGSLASIELRVSEPDPTRPIDANDIRAWASNLRAGSLTRLSLDTMTISKEQAVQLRDLLLLDSLPSSPLLEGLRKLEVPCFDWDDASLERLADRADHYQHLDEFHLGGDALSWPTMKAAVGHVVSTPPDIRLRELSDPNETPRDAHEMHTQIGRLTGRLQHKSDLSAEDLRLVAGVRAERTDGNTTEAWISIYDVMQQRETASAHAKLPGTLQTPEDLRFYDVVPVVRQALHQLGFCAQTDSRAAEPQRHPLPEPHSIQLVLCNGPVTNCGRTEFSLAHYVGALLDLPSIAVFAKPTFGAFETPADEPGASTALMPGGRDRAYAYGACLRTQAGLPPVFLGHANQLSVTAARDIVIELARTTQLPEPLATLEARLR